MPLGAVSGGSSNMFGFNDSSGSNSSASMSSQQVNPTLLGLYKDQLSKSQGYYNQALSLYGQGRSYLQSALPGIYSGYQKLSNQVMNTLGMGQVLGKDGNWGVATPAANQIGQQYSQALSNTSQQMVNRGLGNTTIQGNMQEQNTAGATQAYGSLGAQLANTAAGFQSGIGQAGLAAQMQGTGMIANTYTGAGNAAMSYRMPSIPNLLTSQSQSASVGSQQSGGQQRSQSQQGSYSPVFTPEEQAQAQRNGGGNNQMYRQDPTGGRGYGGNSNFTGDTPGSQTPSAWDYGPSIWDYNQSQQSSVDPYESQYEGYVGNGGYE